LSSRAFPLMGDAMYCCQVVGSTLIVKFMTYL
jgi:hypothetical protein